jgi:deoxyribonuclease-4
MSEFTETLRVREIVNKPTVKAQLLKLIPHDAKAVGRELKEIKTRAPQTMIKLFPNTYSDFGIITELLLQTDVTNDELVRITRNVTGVELGQKTLSLMTTERYMNDVRATQVRVREALNGVEPAYECEIEHGRVQGHPDIMTEDSVFEVKTSTKPGADWGSYLVQLFSYVALAWENEVPVRTAYIVLPLQSDVWVYDVTSWSKQHEYMNVLQNANVASIEDRLFGPQIIHEGGVGPSIHKVKGPVVRTLIENSEHGLPFQFFLNGNLGADLKITDAEIQECRAFTLARPDVRAFCHLPYTLNLGNGLKDKDGYVIRGFTSYIKAIAEMGFKGGVVHVGKANNYSVEESLDNMRHHILEVMEYATADCPILLETPAGQGSELLTTYETFTEFVKEIDDPRFGFCFDLCHVFSSGMDAAEYMRRIFEDPELSRRLRLIHFTDSQREKGSCVDRHAAVGLGCIPKQDFLDVAYYANVLGVAMILE